MNQGWTLPIIVMGEEQAKDFVDEIKFLPEKEITIGASRERFSITEVKEKLKADDFALIKACFRTRFRPYITGKDNRFEIVSMSKWREADGANVKLKPGENIKDLIKQQEEPVLNFEFKVRFGILGKADEETIFNAHSVTKKNPIKLVWLD